jgi:hypothetical protein
VAASVLLLEIILYGEDREAAVASVIESAFSIVETV